LPPPKTEYCWELLDRAAKAEGNVEAILVKLATERYLDEKNARDLGLFRQAYQQLRESFKEKELSNSFQRDSAEYYLFDELSCEFLKILSFNKTMKKKDYIRVNKQIHAIKDIGSEQWKEAVKERKRFLEIEYKQEEKVNLPSNERKAIGS
jgi:hydrogenase maturation factor